MSVNDDNFKVEDNTLEQTDDFDTDFNDFGDEFVNAGDNQDDDDDDFGDFDDFEESPEPIQPKTPTQAELYADVLEKKPAEMQQFMTNYLTRLWDTVHTTDEEETTNIHETSILNSACSVDLWSKLSRDTVFYNPVTGAVGQFQWTRSETNKSYLNALGVTFNHEEKSPIVTKKRQSNPGIRHTATPPLSPIEKKPPQTHTRSASVSGGLKVVTTPKMDESAKEAKKEAEQELELDIDIARAYCELTEDTIRIFPDVKLNAMVTELSRLQKQAGEYLESLLDQREKLKMDAETYNDLISCIVGHAQRLHVHSKDGSPAMVTKTKKSNNGFLKRKTVTAATQSVSMGGGVVGLKKQAPKPNRTMSSNTPVLATSDTRRSM